MSFSNGARQSSNDTSQSRSVADADGIRKRTNAKASSGIQALFTIICTYDRILESFQMRVRLGAAGILVRVGKPRLRKTIRSYLPKTSTGLCCTEGSSLSDVQSTRLVVCQPLTASIRDATTRDLHRQSSQLKRIAQKWKNLLPFMRDLHGKR